MRTTYLSRLNNVMEYEDKHLKMAGGYNVRNVMTYNNYSKHSCPKSKAYNDKIFLVEPLSNMKHYFKYS